MVGGIRKVCRKCSEVSVLGSNGVCKTCFGSGQNVRLSEADPLCPQCGGTGSCPVCGGSGFLPRNGVPAPADARKQRIALISGVVLAVLIAAALLYSLLRRHFDLRALALIVFFVLLAIRVYVRLSARKKPPVQAARR